MAEAIVGFLVQGFNNASNRFCAGVFTADHGKDWLGTGEASEKGGMRVENWDLLVGCGRASAILGSLGWRWFGL